MMQVLPPPMAAVIRFACLTGLRPSESIESIKLLNGPHGTLHYDANLLTLEHFRFSQLFIKTTKKAYLSYLSLDNYHYFSKIGSNTPIPTWNAIRHACRRRNIKMDMRLCRKVFASWLIKSGIDSNTVDMLSGRVPSSVLVRHYQVPDNTLRQRVLDAVASLENEIK